MNFSSIEIIVGLVAVMMGWLIMRQENLQKQLDSKANKEDLEELKQEIKQVSDNVVSLKVDQTRCLTILENLEKKHYGKS